MARSVIRVAIIASTLLIAHAECRAEQIYVQAGVLGFGYTDLFDLPDSEGDFSDFWNQGVSSASAEGSFAMSSASATISLLGPDAAIRLVTHASSEFAGELTAGAAAQWRDTLRLSDTSDLGPTLRAYFEVTGFLQASSGEVPLTYGLNYGLAQVTLYSFTPTGNYDLLSAHPLAGFSNAPQSGVSLYSKPEETTFTPYETLGLQYDPGGGSVRWVAAFDLPYDDTLNGYGLNIRAAASSQGRYSGWAEADLGHTVRLIDVTRSDGSPLSGTVTFDSGFSLQAVPEPSSIIILSTGAIVLLGYGWAQRMAGRAS